MTRDDSTVPPPQPSSTGLARSDQPVNHDTEAAQRRRLEQRMRVLRSEKFAERLRASLVDAPILELGTPQSFVSASADLWHIEQALRERVQRLRTLSEPYSAPPARVARLTLARIPLVRRMIIRLANYMGGRSQLQAALVADCLDLLATEVRQRLDRR